MLSAGFSPPRMPRFDPHLEVAYRASRNERMARTNVMAALIVLITYNVFLLSDIELIPDIFDISVYIRIGLITPLIIACLIAQQWIIKARPASTLPGRLSALVGVALFASIVFLQVATQARTAAEYFTGCLVVLVGFNSIRYGRFFDQLLATAAMCIIFWLGMDAADVILPETKMDAKISVLACAILTLLGAYRCEYVERSSFQAEAEARHLRGALAERNAELERLTYVDPLTGIANRRALEAVLSDGIQVADSAVLMIDVDHFKAYNDLYGHLDGDRCLARVAEALAGAVRTQDCVARFGGEEFAVVLKGAGLSDVERIGERLRAAVEDLAIPHTSRPDGLRHVTVSIGGERRLMGDPRSLADCLILADAALYSSKTRGRNRFTLGSLIPT